MADISGNKTGGRQKGVPNKKTQGLIDLAQELDADPFLFLVNVMKGDLRSFGYVFRDDEIYQPEDAFEDDEEGQGKLVRDKAMCAMLPHHMIPLLDRVNAAKELMPYLHAKRKSVEIKIDEETTDSHVIQLRYAPRKADGGA